MVDNGELEALAIRKRAEDEAKKIKDKGKEQQRELASQTLTKMVFDIIEMSDKYGDDVIIWVFTDQGTRDLRPNQKVVIMVVWPSPMCHPRFTNESGACTKLGIRFAEALFRDGKLWDVADNQNVILKIQNGEYPY